MLYMEIDILDGIEDIIKTEDLDKLKIDWATDIAYLSRGLGKDEILAYYGIIEKELSKEDNKFIDIVIVRGKTDAIAEATKFFFDSMKDSKMAASTALSYLTRFAKDWNAPNAVDGSDSKFVFVMKAPK